MSHDPTRARDRAGEQDSDEEGADRGEPELRRSSEDPPPENDPDGGFFPDLLRRGLTLGFTGLFLTEEAVRKALGDSVPRDLIEFALEQSDRTRAEFLDRLGREFGRTLQALDPAEVARRLLDGRTIEVQARFRLLPSEDADRADDDDD